MAHTPGPWRRRGNLIVGADRDDNTARVVCSFGELWKSDDEATSNARLIAAAPELLAAILRLREAFYVKGTKNALMVAFEGTRELISKARGENDVRLHS